MRVFYIGKFENSYRTEQYVAHALRENGCDVRCFDVVRPVNYRAMLRLIKQYRPTILLTAKAVPGFMDSLLAWCKSKGILTVCWLWDLYWGYRRTRPIQWRSDLLFTTDGGHNHEFERAGCNHHILRQGIHAPEYKIFPPKYRYDVGFVGGLKGHPSRRRLIRWLADNYGSRFIHHTSTRGLELNHALRKCRVIVGDSYPSSNYWSNRIYEITGRGGFLLHPETDGLSAEFGSGKHYASYERDNYKEIAWLIEYYLHHDEDREAIRLEGWRHCGQYTYTARAKSLLGIVRAHLATSAVRTADATR